MTPTSELITNYAKRFNASYTVDHGVSSALGFWLLLAFLAPCIQGEEKGKLEELLGTDAQDAFDRAAQLMAVPHPAVAAAVAVWTKDIYLDKNWSKFSKLLPASIERGDVPDQGTADKWTSSKTMGMVQKFPIKLTPLTALVLVSTLATDVLWSTPFTTATSSELGGRFGQQVTEVLRAPRQHKCDLFTTTAGLVGVHTAHSSDGLVVLSIIGDQNTQPVALHQAASEVVAWQNNDPSKASKISLFDLPLGPGPAWNITERQEMSMSPANRENISAVLPSWSVSSDHDLAQAPGLAFVLKTLEEMFKPNYRPVVFQAQQTALASFGKDGFKAAAVTTIGARAGAVRPSDPSNILVREATILFNRPYAVLAITKNAALDTENGWGYKDLGCPNWQNVPVFSVWIENVK